MKMTNKQMYDSVVVMAQAKEKGKLGYAIARNRRKLESEVVEYSQKRDEIIKKYGKQIEGTNRFELQTDALTKINGELAEYNDITCEVDVMQVSLDELCSGNLDCEQMYVLDWMVKNEEEK